MTRHLINSDEAEWVGHERVWAGISQYPPRKSAIWPILKTGLAFGIAILAGFCVVVAIGATR